MKINGVEIGGFNFASYSVSGTYTQSLATDNVIRYNLTGNTKLEYSNANYGLYNFMVNAGTYSLNLGTYSNYNILSSDLTTIGSTGSGLTGSFTLQGTYDGDNMWITYKNNFINMPVASAPPAPALDADFEAYKTRVEGAGGSLSSTEISAGNQLVLDMKSAGIFGTIVKAAYPFIGSSAAAQKQNLISSNFTGTFSGSWTHNSNGIVGNGTDTKFDTGFNMNDNTTLNSAHYGFYLSQRETTTAAIGAYSGDGSKRSFAFTNLGNTAYLEWGDTYVDVVTDASGVYGLGLLVADSGTMYGYYNGSLINSIAYGGGVESNNFTYGCRSDDNSFGNGTFAFGTLGLKMSSTQSTAYMTAINTFQTTLSRNTY